jgi:hypothetical protein
MLQKYIFHDNLSRSMFSKIHSVFTSNVVDHGFEPQSGQTRNYKIGICGFPSNHALLSRKSKACLVRNQDNVSESDDMSIRELMFQ